MEWWQHALVNFGISDLTCLICHEKFPTDVIFKEHVIVHTLEEFQRLKFHVSSIGTEKVSVNSCELTPLTRRIPSARRQLTLGDAKQPEIVPCSDSFNTVANQRDHLSDSTDTVHTDVDNEEMVSDTKLILSTKTYEKRKQQNSHDVINEANSECDVDGETADKHKSIDINISDPELKKKKMKSRTSAKNSYEPIYTCEKCEFSVKKHEYYHKHLLSKHTTTNDEIQCWYCEKIFQASERHKKVTKKKRGLKNATEGADNEIVTLDYTCPLCSYSLASSEELDLHLKYVHPDEIIDKSQEELESLKASIKADATAEIISAVAFYCHICNWKSNRHFNYHRHVLSHTIGKSFQCTYCDKIIRQSNSSTGYGQISHTCKKCNRTFHSKFKLDMHLFESHGEKAKGSRVCTICGFVARSKKTIERHHMLEHGLQPFSSDGINIIKSENKKESSVYTCEECGYNCNRKDTMNKHKLTHMPQTERTLYACEMCEYQTYVQASLNMHISKKHKNPKNNSVNGEPLYSCEICHKFASTNKNDVKVHRDSCILIFDDLEEQIAHRCKRVKVDGEDFIDAIMDPSLGPQHNITSTPKPIIDTEQSELDTENLDAVEEKGDESIADASGFVLDTNDKNKRKKLYICDQCDSTFKRRWNLERHKEAAHVKKERKCEHCDYCTKNYKALYNHYTNVHMLDAPQDLYDIMIEREKKLTLDKEKTKMKALTIRKSTRHVINIHQSNQKPELSTLLMENDNTSTKICANCLFRTNSMQELITHHQSKVCVSEDVNMSNYVLNTHGTGDNWTQQCSGKELVIRTLKSNNISQQSLTSDNALQIQDTSSCLQGNEYTIMDHNRSIFSKPPSYTEAISAKKALINISDIIQASQDVSVLQSLKEKIALDRKNTETCDSANKVTSSVSESNQYFVITGENTQPDIGDIMNEKNITLMHAMNEKYDVKDSNLDKVIGKSLPCSSYTAEGSPLKNETVYNTVAPSDSRNLQCNQFLKYESIIHVDDDVVSAALKHSLETGSKEVILNITEQVSKDNKDSAENNLDVSQYTGCPSENSSYSEQITEATAKCEENNKDSDYKMKNAEKMTDTKLISFTSNSTKIVPDDIQQPFESQLHDNVMVVKENNSNTVNNDFLEQSNKEDMLNSQVRPEIVVDQQLSESSSNLPQFIIEKKDDSTTIIIVQNNDGTQVSYEIQEHLNVGPNGELPENLYNFISEMLNKQTNSGNDQEDVVYCDIVVNE